MIGRWNLLVLRCRDIDASRRFYEILGMEFAKHAHGSGPEHYASESSGGVFELYPLGPEQNADKTGLGFGVKNLEAVSRAFEIQGFKPAAVKDEAWGRTFVIRDPDERRVEIKEEI